MRASAPISLLFAAVLAAWAPGSGLPGGLASPAASTAPGAALPAGPGTGDVARLCYRPPVDAAVVDPFRPPSTRWGPGNRGLTYRTVPGTAVLAAARGVVTFAGLVAGQQYVTVLHPDGLHTTYSYLATVEVWIGGPVRDREPVGTTGTTFQFGVRRGTTYLDPAGILARRCGPTHAVLVPLDGART